MLEKFFNLNWPAFWLFLTGPVLMAAVWFALDYAVRRLYEKSALLDRLFSDKEKLKPIKRAILIIIRIMLGIYFVFIILDHFSIASKPVLSFPRAKLWGLLTGPVLTVAIWIGFDYIVRVLYEKSAFIEKLFSRYARVRTFKSLTLQMCRVLLGIYFVYTLLGFFNVDPRPLLAGIGVVGLGLSLAAQNILRDFLTGLFIIIEDQFNIGDWIMIGEFSGTVESFTMRVTRLRASDGKLIIIPNGSITQIVNGTKDYAVAVVDVNVSYSADARSVMEILHECAADVRQEMPGSIVEKPNVLGIIAFRESDFQLRVSAKTMPGEQWQVERALRMAIKEKLDKNGVKVPFKHIVIHTDELQ